MVIVNFSHPLTPAQLAEAAAVTGTAAERVVDVRTQFDHRRPFADQARDLVDAAELTAVEWQTIPLAVNPPSLAPIAMAVLAELHGRAGYFPPVLRLRPVAGAVPPRFEVAEVLDLQSIRDAARGRR